MLSLAATTFNVAKGTLCYTQSAMIVADIIFSLEFQEGKKDIVY